MNRLMSNIKYKISECPIVISASPLIYSKTQNDIELRYDENLKYFFKGREVDINYQSINDIVVPKDISVKDSNDIVYRAIFYNYL